jgi:hypothetical protein
MPEDPIHCRPPGYLESLSEQRNAIPVDGADIDVGTNSIILKSVTSIADGNPELNFHVAP